MAMKITINYCACNLKGTFITQQILVWMKKQLTITNKRVTLFLKSIKDFLKCDIEKHKRS